MTDNRKRLEKRIQKIEKDIRNKSTCAEIKYIIAKIRSRYNWKKREGL